MDAFTDIGWFMYISLDSYKCMDAFTDIGWFMYISLDSYKVWMHLQTLIGFCTSLLILIKCGCIYRHWLVSVHIS